MAADTQETIALETPSSAGRLLRVTFYWSVDRYHHRVELVEAGQVAIMCGSSEGDSLTPWPPSPALQQASLLPSNDTTPVALLLGMAGKSHWSVSAHIEANSQAIVFDVACRYQQAPERLGSQYTVHTDVRSLAPPELPVVLQAKAIDNQLCCVQQDDGEFFVRPAGIALPPSTMRWKYCWRLREPTV